MCKNANLKISYFMHDFRENDPGKMNYTALADRAKQFKETSSTEYKEVATMDSVVDEIKEEGMKEGLKEWLEQGAALKDSLLHAMMKDNNDYIKSADDPELYNSLRKE